MNTKLVEDIAAAVLYEGYLLYPYRASAIKNRQRWNFGVLYPRAYAERQTGADAWSMRIECLLRADPSATPVVRVRFLQLISRESEGQTSQGAVEREILPPRVPLSKLTSRAAIQRVAFPQTDSQQPLEAAVEIKAKKLGSDLYKLRVIIFNYGDFSGESREAALLQSPVSTHAILRVDRGEFMSLLDPPEDSRGAAAACENVGAWPVLVGEEGQRDAMLCSPIILYDYPRIAPESPGALFDGTEIDEILTLRILTLTDEEKLAMGKADERTRQILERTESMPPEQFMKLHGVLRGLRGADQRSDAEPAPEETR